MTTTQVIAFWVVTGAIGVISGLALRRKASFPQALKTAGFVMLLCATWLSCVGGIMTWRNYHERLAHIPLPGPGWITGNMIVLFMFSGLLVPGFLASAWALPAGKGTWLRVACVALALYTPCLAFWTTLLVFK